MHSKDSLESYYKAHHERGKRYGYLFCHGARGPFLKKWIGLNQDVLDLGCRDGMLTAFYAEGNRVTGADVDRKALDLAKKRLSIETVWLDLNSEWPFKENAFDVIVACEILEHLFFIDRFFENILATLRPGGIFIGSVPNAFRMRNRWKFLFGKEYETDPTHVRQFSPRALQTVLLDKFQSAEIQYVQGKILPFLKVSSVMPKALNRLFAKDLLWKAEVPKKPFHNA